MAVPKERIAATLKTLNSTQDSIKGSPYSLPRCPTHSFLGASRLIKQYNDQAPEVAKIFLDEVKKGFLTLLRVFLMIFGSS